MKNIAKVIVWFFFLKEKKLIIMSKYNILKGIISTLDILELVSYHHH